MQSRYLSPQAEAIEPRHVIHPSAPPGFATRSVDELKRHLALFDCDAVLDIDDPATFCEYRHRVVRLAAITLSLSSIVSSGGYQLRFSPRDEYCLSIPLNAYGSFTQGPGPAVLIGPNQTILKYWQDSSTFVAVHIPAELFERQIRTHDLPGPVTLAGQLVKPLLQLITMTFANTTDALSPMAGPAVCASLDGMILALLDRMLVMSPMEELRRPCGTPYYILRAERHMRESLALPFVLEDVAAAAGICPRTLQYGFRKHHDTTPMAFFKKMRLARARDEIVANGAGKSLSAIAWDLGYNSASHFSDDYRMMFGESPSSTVRRLRMPD